MYLIGKGHDHDGPGTSMVQRIDWTQQQESQLVNARRGLGCAGRCGGNCGKCGGLGLFETGFDPSGWNWPEYTIVALGLYMVASTVFTTGRAVGRVRAIPGERRKRKAAHYRKLASELSAGGRKKKGLF